MPSSGSGRSEAALEQARRRAQLLGVLAGTVPARGPGLLLTIDDPEVAALAERTPRPLIGRPQLTLGRRDTSRG